MARKKRKKVTAKQLSQLREKGTEVKYQPRQVVLAQMDELLARLERLEVDRKQMHAEILQALGSLAVTMRGQKPAAPGEAKILKELVARLEELSAAREPVAYDFKWKRDPLTGFSEGMRAIPLPPTKH